MVMYRIEHNVDCRNCKGKMVLVEYYAENRSLKFCPLCGNELREVKK